jgi:hypothetical protein
VKALLANATAEYRRIQRLTAGLSAAKAFDHYLTTI